jgi:NADH-quinone oxidoreductase subunit M
MFPLYFPILLLIPLVFAVAIALRPAGESKHIALVGSVLAALWTLLLLVKFDWANPATFVGYEIPWIPSFGLTISMGVDSIALMLVALTAFIMPPAVLGAYSAVQDRQRLFYSWLLVLQGAMVGVFAPVTCSCSTSASSSRCCRCSC